MPDTLVPPGSFRGAPLPWWAKIAAKLVISRLPVPHEVWAALNIFRHSYSSGDSDQQLRDVQANLARHQAKAKRLPRTVLELGPGEITTRAVAYRALGIERTIFVDIGDFGTRDVGAYKRVAHAAKEQRLDPPDLDGARDRAEVFERCGVDYHVKGLEALARLPDASVDFVLSVAVVEHIRRHELAPTFAQLRRVMADDALAWHTVDFQDHIGGKLENLRFSATLWESEWMSGSGFYTNRTSASEIVRMLADSGLEVTIEERALWPMPPTTRSRIAPDVGTGWTDEDLHICSISVSAKVPHYDLKLNCFGDHRQDRE
jgi:hypothetical protein